MFPIDEKLERLINRSLDGGLDEDAQLELNRELIRNPAARAMLAEYQAIDQKATAALKRAFDEKRAGTKSVFSKDAPRPAAAHRRHVVRWLIPGAIAAALLATVIPHPSFHRPAPSDDRFVTPPGLSLDSGTGRTAVPARTVSSSSGNSSVHRDRGRDIIGVMGDDGNLYWIEVEKTLTVTRPHGTPAKSSDVF